MPAEIGHPANHTSSEQTTFHKQQARVTLRRRGSRLCMGALGLSCTSRGQRSAGLGEWGTLGCATQLALAEGAGVDQRAPGTGPGLQPDGAATLP